MVERRITILAGHKILKCWREEDIDCSTTCMNPQRRYTSLRNVKPVELEYVSQCSEDG